MENSGNLKYCQGLMGNSRKFEGFIGKPGNLRNNVKMSDQLIKCISADFSFLSSQGVI